MDANDILNTAQGDLDLAIQLLDLFGDVVYDVPQTDD
jgi:hypothetical protein